MKMDEALEWAADFAERAKIFEPVRNERGYADGWKIPTPAERSDIIIKLAREALREQCDAEHVKRIPTLGSTSSEDDDTPF